MNRPCPSPLRLTGALVLTLFVWLLPAALPAPNGEIVPEPDPAEPSLPDPIAMAVQDVVRGKNSILKVLPKLDAAIVPALEQAYLETLGIDDEEALLLTAQLGDERYNVREQATQTLIAVPAEIDAELQKQFEAATDPEVRWRLDWILSDRAHRPIRDTSLLNQALELVYNQWFDDLVEVRAARLLNDPEDDPAALFFARAQGERIAARLAKRPAAEQARLWLGALRMNTTDARTIRALGSLDAAVLIQAARDSGWCCEWPLPKAAGETVLYRSTSGNAVCDLLFIPQREKRLYTVRRAYCIFQIPFGAGNPRPQTGVILRGRQEYRLDLGDSRPNTTRRLIYGVPPGLLLPKIPFTAGMDEDWNGNLTRMPMWAKPFTPPEALKDSMKFVLVHGHEMPQPTAEDRNLMPVVSQFRLRQRAADRLAAPPPIATDDPNADPTPEDWTLLGNTADLTAAVTRLGATGQKAWVPVLSAIAQNDRGHAGRAALYALHALDPNAAAKLALRLSRVQWEEGRAHYAVDFLREKVAQTPIERAWDFEHRLTPPDSMVQRIPQ